MARLSAPAPAAAANRASSARRQGSARPVGVAEPYQLPARSDGRTERGLRGRPGLLPSPDGVLLQGGIGQLESGQTSSVRIRRRFVWRVSPWLTHGCRVVRMSRARVLSGCTSSCTNDGNSVGCRVRREGGGDMSARPRLLPWPDSVGKRCCLVTDDAGNSRLPRVGVGACAPSRGIRFTRARLSSRTLRVQSAGEKGGGGGWPVVPVPRLGGWLSSRLAPLRSAATAAARGRAGRSSGALDWVAWERDGRANAAGRHGPAAVSGHRLAPLAQSGW